MKKFLVFALAAALIMISASICSAAADENEFYSEQLESSGAENLIDALPESVREAMADIGMDELDFSAIFNASPRKLVGVFFELVRGEYQTPAAACVSVAAVLVFFAVFMVFSEPTGKNAGVAELAASMIAAVTVVVPLSQCIDRVCASISVCGNFMLAFIPVFAGIITAAGNPMLAVSYNSFLFFAAQGISAMSAQFVKPLAQITLSFGIVCSTVTTVNFGSIIAFIKKTTIFFLSSASTLFITALTLKGILAGSADSMSVRGIRFLIGNLIPVVGRAISDGYSSISAGINLIKNTVGAFAIVAVALIVLPCVIECLCWTLCLFLSSTLAEMLNLERMAELIKALSAAAVLLCSTLVFTGVTMIISIAVLLLMKGSA